MKILQIIPSLGCGGAEHFVRDLAIELESQGQECDVLCFFDYDADNALAQSLSGKIKVFSLHKKPGFQPSVIISLLSFIKSGGYDVVNAHLRAINYLLLAPLFLKKTRFFATIHSDARFEADGRLGLLARLFLFKLGLCVPITISEESQSSFFSLYKVDSQLIPNGVSPYIQVQGNLKLKDFEEQLVFIHVASCQPVKNQEMLFKAFNRLVGYYPGIKLLWAGSYESNPDLFEELRPLMKDRIFYLGVLDNPRDYMAKADAICLASTVEGMPITIIEAFSTGCIPVCTPAGGCKNMIEDGINGILSEKFDEDSYYDAMKRFVDLSADARRSMKTASFASFSRYAIATCARSYCLAYSGKNQIL